MVQTTTRTKPPVLTSPLEAKVMNGCEWGIHFQGKYESRKMISAPDLYQTLKYGSSETIRELRNELAAGRLLTDTKHFFYGEVADISHNSGTTLVEPIEYKKIVVPVYDSASSWKVAREKDGALWLQALFDTKDSATEIANCLDVLANGARVNVITPSSKHRASSMLESMATFYYDFDSGAIVIDCKNSYRGMTKAVSIRSE